MPYTEAAILSIYFEETAAYNYRIHKEQEAQTRSMHGGADAGEVVLYHTDDDDDDALYVEVQEE